MPGVLPSAAAVAELLNSVRTSLPAPLGRQQEASMPLSSLLVQLHVSNLHQWQLESACRDPGATDSTLGGLKRQIDAANARRHRLIEAIDVVVRDALPRPVSRSGATLASPYSETIGQILDRLSILKWRIHFLSLKIEEDPHATSLAPSRDSVHEQFDYLLRCYEFVTAALQSGEIVVPLLGEHKLY